MMGEGRRWLTFAAGDADDHEGIRGEQALGSDGSVALFLEGKKKAVLAEQSRVAGAADGDARRRASGANAAGRHGSNAAETSRSEQ
jgi:hypothetical protein